MARQKNRGNEKGQAIAKLIMEQYQPQNKEEMQDAIKDVLGPMLEAMLQGDIAEFDRFKETWKHYPGAVAVMWNSFSIMVVPYAM